MLKYEKLQQQMANPKLLPKLRRPLLKSIIYPKKQTSLYYNRHLLKEKPQGRAPLTIIEEESKLLIQTGPENIEKLPANPVILTKLIQPLPKPIINPRGKF